MNRQPYRPILITDARPSRDAQLRSRQVRYLVMMSIRVLCLIVGAILLGLNAPVPWLWLPACAIGMVLFPWLAVLVANDRPVKDEHRLRRFTRRATAEPEPLALPAQPTTAAQPPKAIIDVEPN